MRTVIAKCLAVCFLLLGVSSSHAGLVLRVFYDELTGGTIEDLQNAPHFPAGPNPTIGPLFTQLIATGHEQSPTYDVFDDAVDDFGTDVRGFIEIPEDGDYRFFIASDDPSQLLMADPSNPSDHTTLTLVAEETDCCTALFSGARLAARSTDPMTFSRGDKVAFRYFHVEITGDSWVQLGWEKPDGTQEIVSADHLAPFPLNMDGNGSYAEATGVAPNIPANYGPENLTVPEGGFPVSVTVTEGRVAKIWVSYEASQPAAISWTKNGTALDGEILSVVEFVASVDDDGSTFVATIQNDFGQTSSSGTTLTVLPDTEKPEATEVDVGIIDPNILTITFSETVSASTANDTSNYSLNNDATVQSAELQPDGVTVIVTADGIVDSKSGYQLTISGVQDIAASPNTMDTTTFDLALFPGGTILPTPEGLIVSEAEDFFENIPGTPHNWEFFNDVGMFSGDGFMRAMPDAGDNNSTTADAMSAPSPRLDYQVSFPAAGTYNVWSRGYAEGGSDDSTHVGINGEIHTERTEDYNPRSEFVWTMNANGGHNDGRTQSIIDVPSAGIHTFSIWMREDGHRLDKFVLTQDATFTPTGLGPDPSPRSEAEPLPNPDIVFTSPPQDMTGTELQTVTFTVDVEVTSDGQPVDSFLIHWIRDGEIVANGFSYTTEPLSFDSDGSQVQVLVRMPGLRKFSDPVTLTVDADNEPASIVSIGGTPFNTALNVLFSEPVEASSAETVGNYTIAEAESGNSLGVNSAALLADGRTVQLITDQQGEGLRYTLTVSNVGDLASNPNLTNESKDFVSFEKGPGGLTALFYEYPGGGLDGFYEPPRGIMQFPQNYNPFAGNVFNSISAIQNRRSSVAQYFESPNTGDIDTPPPGDVANDYGQVLFGWIRPTETANYQFFVATDDNSELYLSTDDNPANAQLIANEPQWNVVREYDGTDANVNQSAPINLQAGQEYYLEIIMQEGGGGDNLAVAWTTDGSVPPNGSNPIPGDVLISRLPVLPEVTIANIEDGATFGANADVTIDVGITSAAGSTTLVEFFANGQKIGESTSDPFSFTWQNAPVGRHTLTVTVTNDLLGQSFSDPVKIVVGTPPPLVLFVVGDVNLNPSDAGVRDRIQSFGFDVSIVQAAASTAADAEDAVLIVISSTVSSGDVGDKFQSIALPVVHWEQALQDNFIMTGDSDGTDRGTLGDQTSLTIVDDAHTLAGGLSAGDHEVTTAPSSFAWGLPVASADIIAHVVGNPQQVIIYGYDTGDAMFDGFVAPARRVMFFFTDDTFSVLNDNGLALFDAAIAWALDQGIGGPQPEFTGVSVNAGGSVVIQWEGGGTLQKAPTANGPWSDVSGASSPYTFTPGAGETEAYFRVKS